jgi:catalase
MQLFTDRGTPYSFRHMNGYSGHTYVFYNKVGHIIFIQTLFSRSRCRMEFRDM